MEPFSPKLLTILVLISISWAGITCIAILIFFIVYIYRLCLKRSQSKFINPIRRHSTVSSISFDKHSSSIPPIPIKTPIKSTDQHKKSEQRKHYDDTSNVMNEHSYSSYNNKNKYQQQEHLRDENDETTTINESRIYDQHHQKRKYQPVKPMTDVRVIDRHTPYPPDILAREKLMNNIRFPIDDKY